MAGLDAFIAVVGAAVVIVVCGVVGAAIWAVWFDDDE